MRLGKTQLAVLRALRDHKTWHCNGYGCGWTWSNKSETIRIMDSLVKAGFATKDEKGVYRPIGVDTFRVHIVATFDSNASIESLLDCFKIAMARSEVRQAVESSIKSRRNIVDYLNISVTCAANLTQSK